MAYKNTLGFYASHGHPMNSREWISCNDVEPGASDLWLDVGLLILCVKACSENKPRSKGGGASKPGNF